MRYAIINTNSGLVENLIDYDSPPTSPPPSFSNNYIAVQDDTASVGWRYSNRQLTNPNPPPTPSPPTLEQKINAATAECNGSCIHAGNGALTRGIEDLISALIAKGTLAKTDLPDALIAKINARKTIRGEDTL